MPSPVSPTCLCILLPCLADHKLSTKWWPAQWSLGQGKVNLERGEKKWCKKDLLTTSRAKRITPQLQTSALRPSYFSPWNTDVWSIRHTCTHSRAHTHTHTKREVTYPYDLWASIVRGSINREERKLSNDWTRRRHTKTWRHLLFYHWIGWIGESRWKLQSHTKFIC